MNKYYEKIYFTNFFILHNVALEIKNKIIYERK